MHKRCSVYWLSTNQKCRNLLITCEHFLLVKVLHKVLLNSLQEHAVHRHIPHLRLNFLLLTTSLLLMKNTTEQMTQLIETPRGQRNFHGNQLLTFCIHGNCAMNCGIWGRVSHDGVQLIDRFRSQTNGEMASMWRNLKEIYRLWWIVVTQQEILIDWLKNELWNSTARWLPVFAMFCSVGNWILSF